MADEFPAGSVWLVGAGPGDPDLLTRKAERLLRTATIVFYDALVGDGVLALIPASVRQVPVGKRAGRHSKEQGTINDLLVAAALAGERVVRLKGGDPSIFGRSMEECSALVHAGVQVRICPGITAASAAAASAGVSLSLRGLARRVQFATAHKRGDAPLDLDWAALADPYCTTVFYMGRSAAAEISRNLQAAGLSGATSVLLACDVSLSSERLLHTRLDLLHIAVAGFSNDQPTLILVGEAIAVANSAQMGSSGSNGTSDAMSAIRAVTA
ncbi:uroporphyrinogen-III C-methyltransferase [Sphingomonas sp. ABOLD]|uniref:uroporphyrinogen-III C-methyltransferase n=1 Tax=Sphingomonas trueperi TaxID=53317 RepID=A0A7X5Y2Q4_9SPHN|nr:MULTISPECIES: uroporphyrinogen-III C-methyltransferase [Sphingomonas]NJB98660.1 uroporphyrin-III C-methyltransferase [Sphingomonas trueperi]RSV43960.1 uroporphyrinogen-III C-methyltransferase [Sphingomonas sp. ABOLE]RSV45835.1 uroporphyrinogen-III C-methyltransferase [Sphingomonas sp. ABOLD]